MTKAEILQKLGEAYDEYSPDDLINWAEVVIDIIGEILEQEGKI